MHIYRITEGLYVPSTNARLRDTVHAYIDLEPMRDYLDRVKANRIERDKYSASEYSTECRVDMEFADAVEQAENNVPLTIYDGLTYKDGAPVFGKYIEMEKIPIDT